MRFACVLAALAAGCSSTGGTAVREKVDRWAAASMRAYDTRTHATDENPRAQREADALEAELKKSPDARKAVEARRAELETRRRELEGRRNHLMVVGRAHTSKDQEDLDRWSQELERIKVEDGMLAELAKRLTA